MCHSIRGVLFMAVSAIPLTANVPVLGESEDFEMSTTADRWMYPFNATPGFRPAGSTFGYSTIGMDR